MSPQMREQIRTFCNLAELPDDVRAELAAERAAAAAERGVVHAHADRIFALRKSRIKAEIELGKLGDLEAPVRARLNRLMGATR